MSIFEAIGNREHKEILWLFDFCKANGLNVTLHKIYDGHFILFPNKTDVQQHCLSLGTNQGCVEFGYMPLVRRKNKKTGKFQKVKDPLDFAACTFKQAQKYILKNKEKLNTPPKKTYYARKKKEALKNG